MNHRRHFFLRQFALPAFALFIIIGTVSAGQKLTLRGGSASAAVGKSIELALEAGQAKGLGAIQFTLRFDPQVVRLESAELASGINGMIEAQLREAGQLRIKAVLGEGLEADGPLVTVSGKAVAKGACEVRIEELRAWSYEPVLELGASSEPGDIRVGSAETGGMRLGVTGWMLICGGVLVALIIVLLLKKH